MMGTGHPVSQPVCPGLQAIKGKGLVVESFDELQKQGAATPAAAVPPKPDDYCTIMYTSGTTGAGA